MEFGITCVSDQEVNAITDQLFVLLGMEMVGVKWRLLIGIMFNISFALGYAIMSGVAYYLRDGVEFELWIVGLANLMLLFYL